ncbi:hypothetical protein LCGC14_2484460 [marine sediment metagenome]|uniref:Uncharacterized protein n=1 Tax=marine sediment metagenome TaxID=412755 RepID=A0A0F9BUD3_9ZZZZ
MDAEDCVVLVAVLVALTAVMFFVGLGVGGIGDERRYQDAAVERGYAEWVPHDNPRKKNVWQWIEPEEEGE